MKLKLAMEVITTTEYFTGCVTLNLATNFVTKYRLTMALQHKFHLQQYIFLTPHVMSINACAKEFTLMNLVTFSISRSRIRMKFYFVYSIIIIRL